MNLPQREYDSKRLRGVYKRAAKLVAKGWTQKGGYAERADGGVLMNPRDPEAVCWCLHGAVEAAGDEEVPAAGELLGELGYHASWNDRSTRTQAEVVAVLLEMAEACK